MRKTPILFVGGLSGRVFVATKYHREKGCFVADEKFDVTDNFHEIAAEINPDESWDLAAIAKAVDDEAANHPCRDFCTDGCNCGYRAGMKLGADVALAALLNSKKEGKE